MLTQSLNGEWYLYRADAGECVPATVPGCVHTDLLAAGMIPDPFYRDNELQVLWVGETDWIYRRMFVVSDDLLSCEHVLLRCEGLDTIASIAINGRDVGRADNMFRTWEYDARPLLRAGENVIAVAFTSPVRYAREKAVGRRVMPAEGVGQHKLDGGSWIRKEPCNFGWDWGPMLATCGIWKDIALVGYDTARLAGVNILQDHRIGGQVGLDVRVEAEGGGGAALSALVVASYRGQEVARATMALARGQGADRLVIRDPRTLVAQRPGRAAPLRDRRHAARCGRSPAGRDHPAHRPAHAAPDARAGRMGRVVPLRGQRRAVLRQGRQLDPRRRLCRASDPGHLPSRVAERRGRQHEHAARVGRRHL
jgi:hypothetical protein